MKPVLIRSPINIWAKILGLSGWLYHSVQLFDGGGDTAS